MKKTIIIAGAVLLLAIVGIWMYILANHDGTGGGGPAANVTANTSIVNATAPATAETGPWELDGPGPVWQLYTAPDGTLYSFQGPYGDTIKAIAPNGSVEWTYQVSDEWRVSNALSRPVDGWTPGFPDYAGPVFSVDNGVLYLYVRENSTSDISYFKDPFEIAYSDILYRSDPDYLLKEQLMAISDGRVLWNVPIGDEHHAFEDDGVFAQNGRVYVFDNYSVSLFDDNGKKLFRIDNASAPPAVDEDGNVYVVPAVAGIDQYIDYAPVSDDAVFKVPASIVQAYSPNGSLMWQADTGNSIVQLRVDKGLTGQFDTLPFYKNHTLYVHTSNDIVALSTNGSILWENPYNNPSVPMSLLSVINTTNVYADEANGANIQLPDGSNTYVEVGSGGNLAWTGKTADNISLTLSIPSETDVIAVSPSGGGFLWGVDVSNNGTPTTVISNSATLVTMDTANMEKLLILDEALINKQLPIVIVNNTPVTQYNRGSESLNHALSSNDTIFIYTFSADYELPIAVNQSRCYYASVLCAINKSDGTILWSKPLDAYVTSMAFGNGTLYYGTLDGRVFGGLTRQPEQSHPVVAMVTNDDVGKVVGTVAGGATVAAAALLFLKFFGLGGLARARSQLSKNDNRNRLMSFIEDRPGSTLHEISSSLEMNVGTVRYHLLILGLNHRIASFQSDGKFVRYFANAGSYTRNEQFLLSLVRREQVRNILSLLMERAGLSNVEISQALGIHESATCRYLNELASRGVLDKQSLDDGRTAYSIDREYREPVARALGRINGN